MGRIKKHQPVKLVAGFIFKQEEAVKKATTLLERKFGSIDFESQTLNFTHTDYYAKEFGTQLKKKFVSFKKLIPADKLPEIKIFTNKIEKKLTKENLRTVNIDPGYLDLAKFVLASSKDYKHRIYLNCGIYAEVTLFYQNKNFRAWDWTYPDYRTAAYIEILNRIRDIYAQQIKA